MEDYLKSIYIIQAESDGRVKTAAIASHLDVKPPTVTSMVKKLAEKDLANHEAYKGVELTPTGKSVALEVIRHHRLLETYLTEELGYDWSEVHDEADQLEHHVSEMFIDRIDTQLNEPQVDPHGDPIPSTDSDTVEDPPGSVLTDFDENDAVVIQQVRTQDTGVLRYLDEQGIRPGISLTIEEVTPIGMITIHSDSSETTLSLPNDVARYIRARPSGEVSPPSS
ncbi:metal-dependent transcriptional regulator (plasmid) [Natrinema zhouii]|uniref:metal-dependent transcriptional regulator n=1 Tax=Natrinema zhouii TaxID=1710539 RepID=UPI001E456646|nr:metal-dependent transcriptional regulator [Natrinema zhouii]UHQ99286.1 metal-dependent transcriptional regulator [Natrinema zhouii]